ncbi:hypothetical protein AVEN_187537-1 [Araneus ventricosus]|uniref:Amidase domain-containing protein n=1 Tax=Araneus ventricosus TaxID=182803 RepID=A0A4Y2BV96_ARAVE|nr:hypothetical protein AVEN_187537-1 [Araneus ventricosus]
MGTLILQFAVKWRCGESALIAAGGSILGIGNDLLGSLRIPAHFTGIFSHKPTRGLIPNEGCFPPENPGKPSKPSDTEIYKYVSTGPMCRYAEDLIISMKSLSSANRISLNFDEKRQNFIFQDARDWTTEFAKILDKKIPSPDPTSPRCSYNSEVILIPQHVLRQYLTFSACPTHCPMGFTKQGLPYGIQIVGRANKNSSYDRTCAVELEKGVRWLEDLLVRFKYFKKRCDTV